MKRANSQFSFRLPAPVRRRWLVAVRSALWLGSAAMVGLTVGCGAGDNEYVPPPPPEVTVAQPVTRQVTLFLEENGLIEAVDEAEVRARVRGFVESIEFEPGQVVKKGDVLYQIEKEQYQASVNSAKASVRAAEAAEAVAESMVKVAQAEAKGAQQELTRQKSLMEKRAGSQADLDAAVAANDAAAAALDSAKANVEAAVADKGSSVASLAQAQLDLDYTTVRSPIDGRISPTDIKVGNLVDNGGQLATVVNRTQVYVNFSISDREMLEFMKKRRAKLGEDQPYEEPDWSDYPVYLKRELDDGFPFTGVLDYVDQEGIDSSTGTLRMRSLHDNPDDQLFPGLFVTVRVPEDDPVEALLLPEYAVLRDQRGKYVLAIGSDNKVQRVSISVGETISGWVMIDDGISSDVLVVVDGLQRARPGLEVKAINEKLAIDDESLLRGFSPTSQQADSAKQASPPEQASASEEE